MLSERVKEWNKQSLERGMQQGALQMLKRQLEVKFGPLPKDVITQLNKADEETILNWSEQILAANSLGDIFGH